MSTARRVDSGHLRPAVNSEILDRQPPCNVQAEQGVLGSILLLPEVCDDVALIVRPEDFYDEANQSLFEHIQKMHDVGRKIDPTLLVDSLKRSGVYERIGGAAYLARIGDSVATAANAGHYARIVRDTATYRALILASTEILRDAYEQRHGPVEMVSQAEQRIFSILDHRSTSAVADVKKILHEAMDRIDARMRGEHTTGGVDTGFTELDSLTGGLHNSELTILASRPSMGKTALAMNIAEYVTCKLKLPVLYTSLEMSSVELADRLLCSVAEVNGQRLRNGTISKKDRQRLVEKMAIISESPLYVDDAPSRTVPEIAAAARRIWRPQKALGLVIVDYLQLVEPDNSDDSRQEQVAKITRRLKGLAREMKVPVLCLAQLNRQAETAKDNRPRLSHLRESGAIEQDADVVVFVHREEYYRSGEERDQVAGDAELIVAKQRNGPIGRVPLLFHKEHTRFVNPATRAYDEFEHAVAVEPF